MAGAPLIHSYVTDPSYYNIELITRKNPFLFPLRNYLEGYYAPSSKINLGEKPFMYQELFIVQGHEEAR